jgi:hypothetical protein
MRTIERAEILDLVAYERVREAMRARIIELKKSRRVSVGDRLTFLFENRDTVLFQIQEMIRTERMVEEGTIQDELDAYNALIPAAGELSATLFIEIPELVHLGQEEVRRMVNRFQGLDRQGVSLQVGEITLPAHFEQGHSKEEKMAAVHYLRFLVPAKAASALADESERVLLAVDHPHYQAERELPGETRAELLKDLA